MSTVAGDVVSGINDLVSSLSPNVTVSLYGFESANGLQIIIDEKKVSAIQPLLPEDYVLGDKTPLYDAIARSLLRNSRVGDTDNSGVTSFVIISDGEENASTEFTLEMTRKVIRDEIEGGTEILFFALGTAAATEAQRLGIELADRASFSPDSDGVKQVFDGINRSFAQDGESANTCRLLP